MESHISRRVKQGLWLGLIASVVAFAHLSHNADTVWRAKLESHAGGADSALWLFLSNYSFAAFSAFACAIIGFLLAERYKLSGAGDFSALPKLVKWLAAAAVIALPLGYFLYDSHFIEGAKQHGWVAMLPSAPFWAVIFVLYGAVFKETVFRFGMLTLAAGLFRGRRNGLAVLLTAAFTAGLSMKELSFAGHSPGYDAVTLSVFVWALLLNGALCAVCAKKGLWASMALRAFIESRFIAYALLGIC